MDAGAADSDFTESHRYSEANIDAGSVVASTDTVDVGSTPPEL